jgi:hypothetical protein
VETGITEPTAVSGSASFIIAEETAGVEEEEEVVEEETVELCGEGSFSDVGIAALTK